MALPEKTRTVDTVIVGAGFAGAVAGRELSAAGREVLILEGRDRAGGRTQVKDWHGFRAELGGQWVHWMQPHVWAEVTRYGLPLYERQSVEVAHWLVNGRRRSAPYADLHSQYAETWAELSKAARTVFPRPYEPLAGGDELRDADAFSVGDRLDASKPGPDAAAISRALISVMFNAPGTAGAWTQLLRRVALAHWDADFLAEGVAAYKLRDGSSALLERLLCNTELRLGAIVRTIYASSAGVTVELADGQRIGARTAIVTVPIHALARIKFEPALSEAKQSFLASGQVTRGAMLWVRARGVKEPFLALSGGEGPVSYARWDGELQGAALLNVFLPDARTIDLRSRLQLEAALQRLVPSLRVVDWCFHDWTRDPFSGQTWTMLHPRQLSSLFAGLQRSEGLVHFAGADYASGWFGFIDGAIESGLCAARAVREVLDHNSKR